MSHLLAAPLALTLLLAPAEDPVLAAAVDASGPALPVAPPYSLGALAESPAAKLGETVTVKAQFQGELEDWEPYLSRYCPEDHRAFVLWGDEQWLWIEEEYEAPMAVLFVRRGTLAEATLGAARPHDRFELDVTVAELHAGRAWIEATRAVLTPEQTPEGTVLHTIRALDMIEREGWRLALSELDRALAPNLPGHVRRELETIRARCQDAWDALERRRGR